MDYYYFTKTCTYQEKHKWKGLCKLGDYYVSNTTRAQSSCRAVMAPASDCPGVCDQALLVRLLPSVCDVTWNFCPNLMPAAIFTLEHSIESFARIHKFQLTLEAWQLETLARSGARFTHVCSSLNHVFPRQNFFVGVNVLGFANIGQQQRSASMLMVRRYPAVNDTLMPSTRLRREQTKAASNRLESLPPVEYQEPRSVLAKHVRIANDLIYFTQVLNAFGVFDHVLKTPGILTDEQGASVREAVLPDLVIIHKCILCELGNGLCRIDVRAMR